MLFSRAGAALRAESEMCYNIIIMSVHPVEEIIHFLNTFIAIFVIVDPFAMVPVYLALTERFTSDMIQTTRRRATLIATGILLTFALSGLSIFRAFGITLAAFKIAGGILLLLLGIQQLNNQRTRVKPEEESEGLERLDITVFPLATPLLAGPGAISTIVLLSTQAKNGIRMVSLAIATIVCMFTVYQVLKIAPYLFQFFGRTGLNLITRLMGLILAAEAIQFILSGIADALPYLKAHVAA